GVGSSALRSRAAAVAIVIDPIVHLEYCSCAHPILLFERVSLSHGDFKCRDSKEIRPRVSYRLRGESLRTFGVRAFWCSLARTKRYAPVMRSRSASARTCDRRTRTHG